MVHSVSAFVCVGVLALSACSVSADKPTYEQWKKSAYYKEAYNKKFLPPSTYKTVDTNGGMFTMGDLGGVSTDSSAIAEEKKRFEQALATIEELKKQHPHAVFSMSTPFALMTQKEFLSYVNRNNVDLDVFTKGNTTVPKTESTNDGSGGPKTKAAAAGERVDWQEAGCVTAVKDQAQCGACWAFSATAAMESGVCVSTGYKSLPELADQQLISCDNQGQSQGCGGGYASYTMDWIAKSRSGKMCSMSSYPFTSKDGSVAQCAMGGCREIDVGVTGFESLRNDPGALEDKVRERPVSVFVYSGSSAFQFYKGGILTGDKCDKTGAHSALAVGFGEESGLKYWRLKNQWGTQWGESGYVRIQRRYGDADGACGVESYASWPTFKANLVVDAPNPNFQPAPAPAPTEAPTPAPTEAPTPAPTEAPTPAPTEAPTPAPTEAPTEAPTDAPTQAPEPTPAPQPEPTPAPVPQTPAPVPTPAPTSVTQAPEPRPTPAKTTAAPTPEPSTTAPAPIDQTPTPTPAIGSGDSSDKTCGRLDEGVDYLGNDLKNVFVKSLGDCCALCHDTPGCNAFTFTQWKGGVCFLKSRAGLVVPREGAVSSSLYDISKATHQNVPQEIGYTYPGNDISEEKADAADDCYGICAKTDRCNAFTWSAQTKTCALKTRKVPAAEFQTTNTKDFTSAIVYKCQNIQLDTDFEGADIGNEPARSPEACCAICQLTKGCSSFSWSDFKTGTCWLKSGTGNVVKKGGVVSASL